MYLRVTLQYFLYRITRLRDDVKRKKNSEQTKIVLTDYLGRISYPQVKIWHHCTQTIHLSSMQAIPEDVGKVTTKIVDRACNSEFITESWQGKRTLAGALKTSTTA